VTSSVLSHSEKSTCYRSDNTITGLRYTTIRYKDRVTSYSITRYLLIEFGNYTIIVIPSPQFRENNPRTHARTGSGPDYNNSLRSD